MITPNFCKMKTEQEINEHLDHMNKVKAQLADIEEQNKALKRSRSNSVTNMNKAHKTIEAEKVAILYYDQKIQLNTQEYFKLSDTLKKLIK